VGGLRVVEDRESKSGLIGVWHLFFLFKTSVRFIFVSVFVPLPALSSLKSIMHKSALIAVLLLATASCVLAASSFAIGVPIKPVNNQAQKYVPVLEQDIKADKLPDHCCYDDVGMSHVHLNLQSIHIDPSSVSAGLAISSALSGIQANFVDDFTLDFFLRLCLHDDPFSKTACSTIDNCKGDSYLGTQGSGGIPVKVLHLIVLLRFFW
jgi:hypothetical protein